MIEEQKAIAYLITKSLDENLYFVLVYSRWAREDTWPLLNKTFFGKLPLLMRTIIPKIVRRQVLKELQGQGISRHSNEEIQNILRLSLDSLSTLLGDKEYFFGAKPSSLDAVVFGLLSQFILVNFNNPFNAIAKSYPTLVHYCERIRQNYYQN